MGLSCIHPLTGDWIPPVCSSLFLYRGLYKGAASKGESSWKTGGRQIERDEGENPTDTDYSTNGGTNENWFAPALYLLRCDTSCSSHWSALYHGYLPIFLCPHSEIPYLPLAPLPWCHTLFFPWLPATIAWPNDWEWPSRCCSGAACIQRGQPVHV